VKLLFDNNVSALLPGVVKRYFPGSQHVASLELDQFSDHQLWQYAKQNDFTIVTKDKDFYHLANSVGQPPKVVWLTIGNCTNRELIVLVEASIEAITQFIKGDKDLLVLP
jgi:predicted nuclease of predicted toxin-antitoxin system